MVLLKLTFFGYHREEEKPMGLGASVAGKDKNVCAYWVCPFYFYKQEVCWSCSEDQLAPSSGFHHGSQEAVTKAPPMQIGSPIDCLHLYSLWLYPLYTDTSLG